MSTHISSLLRDRNLGLGLTGKSVILLMADLASDDGQPDMFAKSAGAA